MLRRAATGKRRWGITQRRGLVGFGKGEKGYKNDTEMKKMRINQQIRQRVSELKDNSESQKEQGSKSVSAFGRTNKIGGKKKGRTGADCQKKSSKGASIWAGKSRKGLRKSTT